MSPVSLVFHTVVTLLNLYSAIPCNVIIACLNICAAKRCLMIALKMGNYSEINKTFNSILLVLPVSTRFEKNREKYVLFTRAHKKINLISQ